MRVEKQEFASEFSALMHATVKKNNKCVRVSSIL
jgi:hypothetical protein